MYCYKDQRTASSFLLFHLSSTKKKTKKKESVRGDETVVLMELSTEPSIVLKQTKTFNLREKEITNDDRFVRRLSKWIGRK